MDRRSKLIDLARRLRDAVSASDWSALGAIDRELARALRKEQRTWSPSERAALEDVRRAHSEAWEHCTREATRIDEVLLQMRLHRDGWMAYAMSDAHADLEKARR